VRSPGRRLARAAATFLFACVLARSSRADDVGARFQLDNDQFNFWQKPGDRPDFGYTHGTLVALHFANAPRGLARLAPAWLIGRASPGESAPSLEVSFFQGIDAPWTQFGTSWSTRVDRPYAGWLEGAIGISRSGRREFREVLLHLGVTGPPSLAGALQRYFHRRFDHGEPLPDWSRQLPFEPGLGLEASGLWTTAASRATSPWQATFGPLARVRAGTYADDLRLGVNLVLGLNPAAPWPAAGASPHGPSLYVRATPRLDLVARDEFLDGPLFRAGGGPGSEPWIGESEVVFGAGWAHARLEYAVLRRSKEFAAQPVPHTYSTCAFTWLP